MESKDEIYRQATLKLREIRRATDAYNEIALGNNLYVIGISGLSDEVTTAEDSIPKHILEEIVNP